MDVISNNLANVGTTAYKKDVLLFNEALERTMYGDAGRGRDIGEMGSGPAHRGTHTVFTMGSLSQTGNALDFAIGTGDGMFAVQDGATTKYTRDGVFSLDQDRQLVDKNGLLVMDRDMRAITLPDGKIEVGRDGTIQVNGEFVAELGLFAGKFVKEGQGLYTGGSREPMEMGAVNIQQGYVEGSNVNAVEEMIAMIKLNKAFEMAQRSATSQDEATSQLLRVLSGS